MNSNRNLLITTPGALSSLNTTTSGFQWISMPRVIVFRKGIFAILLLLSTTGLFAQDKLAAAVSSAANVTSGINGSFTDLASVTLDVSNLNSVMVVASFETRYGGAASLRDAMMKISDGTAESVTIWRTLKKTGGDDKGIGTLVYLFDTSTLSGERTFTLKHSSSKNLSIVSSASLVAIGLTTSASSTDLSHDMKSISAPVQTPATLNEWAGVSGLSTAAINLPSTGSLYMSASVNTHGTAAGTGEWKLQYSTDNVNWTDAGYSARRSVSSTNDYGISSLVYTMKDLPAGYYYCRLAHRQVQGTPGVIETLNSSLIAVALVYEDAPGSYREFRAINEQKSQELTGSTSLVPVLSIPYYPSDTTDMFLQAQYVIKASGISDSPAYDLNIDRGILDGLDQHRYISSVTDIGSGGSVGLGQSMLPGSPYTLSLRHKSTSGITLSTENAILTGFQLTSVGKSVWTGSGVSPTLWQSDDNWHGRAPGNRDNAYIPAGLGSYPALNTSTSCHDLTIETGASLTLDPGGSLDTYGILDNQGALSILADAANTGSLIIHGISSGQVSFQSYLTADRWYILAPPVSGQAIGNFLLNGANQIPFNSSGNYYGLTDYDELSNSWNSFFSSSTEGNFVSGRAYLARREISDGSLSFTGTLADSAFTMSITRNGSGWNAVGNPYTSAIGVSANASTSQNLLGQNLAQLDPNFSVLYLWDEQGTYNGTQNNYKVIGNSGYQDGLNLTELDMDYLQAGQGFLVKCIDGGGSLSFSRDMQTHQTGANLLKSARSPWDGFRLVIGKGDRRESTTVCFHETMTAGLDPSYDAGLLSSKPGFSIHTRLVSGDEGIPFKIQCLPVPGGAKLEIPLGVNLDESGEFTFRTEGVSLPENLQIVLEDRWADTLTDLSSEDSSFVTWLDAGTLEPGRFFIHMWDLSTTGHENSVAISEDIQVCYNHQQIRINGIHGIPCHAYLYTIDGAMVGNYTLEGNPSESLPAQGFIPGIYLLRLSDGKQNRAFKILIH